MMCSTPTTQEEGGKQAQVHRRTLGALIVGSCAIMRLTAGKREEERRGRETKKGKAKDTVAVAKAKEGGEAAWFRMTAFDSEQGDFDSPHAGSPSLSDD